MRVLTIGRLQVLRAISHFAPASVYQLASLLQREPHHVLKDCRLLESYGFLDLVHTGSGRGSLRPALCMDFDAIVTTSAVLLCFTISKKAEDQLLGLSS